MTRYRLYIILLISRDNFCFYNGCFNQCNSYNNIGPKTKNELKNTHIFEISLVMILATILSLWYKTLINYNQGVEYSFSLFSNISNTIQEHTKVIAGNTDLMFLIFNIVSTLLFLLYICSKKILNYIFVDKKKKLTILYIEYILLLTYLFFIGFSLFFATDNSAPLHQSITIESSNITINIYNANNNIASLFGGNPLTFDGVSLLNSYRYKCFLMTKFISNDILINNFYSYGNDLLYCVSGIYEDFENYTQDIGLIYVLKALIVLVNFILDFLKYSFDIAFFQKDD